MNNESKITICGKEVKVRYCAATETTFEKLTDKSIADIDFHAQNDILRLAYGAILAAYLREGSDVPLTVTEILTDATPAELITLYKTVFELRAAWYSIPSVVKPDKDEDEEGKKKKNA